MKKVYSNLQMYAIFKSFQNTESELNQETEILIHTFSSSNMHECEQ